MNAATPISWPKFTRFRGDSKRLLFTLTDDNGAALRISDHALNFTIFDESGSPLVTKVSQIGGFETIDDATGKVAVELLPADDEVLVGGTAYQCELLGEHLTSGERHRVRGTLIIIAGLISSIGAEIPVNVIEPEPEYLSAEAIAQSLTAAGEAESKAQEWATKTDGPVEPDLFSSKELAHGDQALTGGSAKNWATQIGADVTGAPAGSRSAKSYAQENLTGTLGGSAKDWAQSDVLPDGVHKSAKTLADESAASAAAALTSENNARDHKDASAGSATAAAGSAATALAVAQHPINRFFDPFWTLHPAPNAQYKSRNRWMTDLGSSAALVTGDANNPCSGKTLRVSVTAGGSFGPRMWLDELRLNPKNTFYVQLLVKAPSGANFRLYGRPKNAANVFVYTQIAGTPWVGTGALQLISLEISPTTIGDAAPVFESVAAYLFSYGAVAIDVYALSVSSSLITTVTQTAVEPDCVQYFLRGDIDANTVAIAAEVSARRGASQIAFDTAYGVGYLTLTPRAAVTNPTNNARDLPFIGWGAKYTLLGVSWNAVRLVSVSRTATVDSLKQWTTCHIEVRACSAGGNGNLGALIAVGSIPVNPAADVLTNVMVLLRDPTTSALKTITDADLTAPFFIGYYFTTAAGSGASAGEARGTAMANYEGNSFYSITAGTWVDYSGDQLIAIEQLYLTGPVEDYIPTTIKTAMLPLSAPASTIPDAVYAVAGQEMNVYFRNLLEFPDDYILDVICGVGQHQSERWSLVAGAATTTTLQVAVYDKARSLLTTLSASLVVAAATAGGGVTRKCLFIGDSTTAAGIYTGELLNLDSADANFGITLLGTIVSGSNKHEGRGGYTVARYYAPGATYYSAVPFVDPALSPSGNFDFAYYLSSTGQTMAANDWVFWHLGINDIYNLTTDAAVESLCDTAFAQWELMITSIKSAVSGVRIGMAICIPPAANQDAFGYQSNSGVSRPRYMRNLFIWTRRFVAQFGGRTASSIFLVPIHLNLDTANNFPCAAAANINSRNTTQLVRQNNDVHPAASGYQQMADSFWAFLKYHA